MKTLIDQTGTVHHFTSTPTRIVCLVPSLTELICNLRLESSLYGITKFCVHPAHLKSSKNIVGGTKKVSYEKIAPLDPDIIICNKEENTEEMVCELRKLAIVWVTDIKTIDDCIAVITAFGDIFNRRFEAQRLSGKIAFERQQFSNSLNDVPVRKAAYFIWKGPYMVAGADTFINEMLRLNKFENIFEAKGRYPEISLEVLREMEPELILLSSEPFPFKDEDAFEIGRHTHHAKTVFVDGEMFSWYGSRLVKAFRYFSLLQERIG